MPRHVVALFCITFIVVVHGASRKTPASIDKDAIEMAQLVEKLWSFKPAIIKRAKPLVYCQVIDHCCEEEDRSKAISLMDLSMDENDFKNVMERCMNTTTSNQENQLCLTVLNSIVPEWTTYMSSDVRNYTDTVDKYMYKLQFNIPFACNSEEIHAFICSSNTKLVGSCARKTLEEIYDYNYKNYGKTIKYIKQTLMDANQELSKIFIKNTNVD
jgi:hypothetical protein